MLIHGVSPSELMIGTMVPLQKERKRRIWKYAKLHDVLFNGSKRKLLVYNKKDADPHCEINGTDVSICEKTIYLGNVLSTTDKYEIVFDGIKKFNCNVNIFMSLFGSLQTVVKHKLFCQYCYALYGSQQWPLWHDSVNKMCNSGVMLCVRYGSYHMVLTEI